MATYETNNNSNVYEEDRSSEISKELSSSASSVVDETKKVIFEDNKEEKSLSSSKRKKRNSFISRLSVNKDDKEGSLARITGIFSKDKDNNRRNNPVESENQLRPTPRTSSSNSDTSKNRRSFVFLSDDDEKLEIDTTKKGRKSRQTSNAEGLEKDKSSKKEKRLSVLGIKFGSNENKSSQKSKTDVWEDSFLEPDETNISPNSLKNPLYTSSSLKNKQNNSTSNNHNNNNDYLTKDYVESPQTIHHDNSIGFDNVNNPSPQRSIADDSPADDVHSTISSTQSSSVDDHEYNSSSPTTPITPVVIVTPTAEYASDQNRLEFNKVQEEHDEKEDKVDQNNAVNSTVESNSNEVKRTIQTSRNIAPLSISTDNATNVADFGERKKDDDAFTNTIGQQQGYDNNTKMLQELETLNKSLVSAKEQLETKVTEISKFNSMEQIMQQQIDLSKRMSETMQRLESKANVQKEEFDGLNASKIFEDTIRRLENKIDRQNDEIIRLKSVVGQLSGGNQQLLLTNGDISHQNLIMTRQGEERALIQANYSQSTQIYSKRTLVSTLVVSPLCNTITLSASIATSVLYAVYVRPVVGLVSVLRDFSTTKCETAD